jgi:dipeptidase
MVSDTPDYLKNVTSEVNTNCMYCHNRIIAALVDAHHSSCLEHVDRYQFAVLSKS